MKFLVIALQFLTVLPVKVKEFSDKADFSKALVCFPVVGFLLGLFLAIMNSVLANVFPHLLLNAILVLILTILTGGLHLDGLADTVDGICSMKEKEKALEIMRDSHIGTMGVLSLIFIILFKVILLDSISLSFKTPVLIIMPVISRWSMLVPLYLFKYARQEGKAKIFFDSMNLKTLIMSAIILFVLVIYFLKLTGFYTVLIIFASTFIIARFLNNKIGGFTGDMLGAVNEINEVLFLFIMGVL
ncbi:MAG: adenosylcobinamide-GDP ribazoletransferase [Elusimicrobia bacterium]|nr:adenosylcobinamide-GDP ribazoletransferase [Candidatus Liberimonas magnetica]